MRASYKQFNVDIDLHWLHRSNSRRYPYILQTVATGSQGGHYDIAFAFPGETLILDRQFQLHTNAKSLDIPETHDFLDAFNTWWSGADVQSETIAELPFSGGWFVYLGYELARQIEPSLELPACDNDLPTAFATRVPAAVIKDHARNKVIAVAEEGNEKQFRQMCIDIAAVAGHVKTNPTPQLRRVDVLAINEDAKDRYINGVEKIKNYIRDGDIFQVNLSRQWQATLAPGINADHLYLQLRENNPAPFCGLAIHGDNAIISSSPERLLRVKGDYVETRPIAGTRPRSAIDIKDHANKSELIAHPKERAEHIMLIDLERNDLGRVCRPGSIKVDELMVLESYAHVHHIVSNVRGMLNEGTLPGDVIRAVFPGGTITGCPKVRCMEIIAELEQTGRGAYTGSMGYINHDGGMDFNILIRTMVKQSNRLIIRAGAGIVADSIARNELEETRAKARGLLLALGASRI